MGENVGKGDVRAFYGRYFTKTVDIVFLQELKLVNTPINHMFKKMMTKRRNSIHPILGIWWRMWMSICKMECQAGFGWMLLWQWLGPLRQIVVVVSWNAEAPIFWDSQEESWESDEVFALDCQAGTVRLKT